MQKIKFLFILVLFAFAQNLFAQLIFSEDFEKTIMQNKVGNLPEGWTLYSDNNKPNTKFFYCDKAWKIITVENTNLAEAPSWFTNENARADRWMITPKIDLAGATSPYLFFDAQSGDKVDLEKYYVLISITDTLKEAFTDTLLNVNAENPEWTKHALDLSPYQGEKVHLAFVLRSLNKYSLYIDNVQIIDIENPILSIQKTDIPTLISKDSSINISYSARLLWKEKLMRYKENYLLDGVHSSREVALSDQEIGNLSVFSAQIPSFSIPKDGRYSFRFWLSDFNGKQAFSSDTVDTFIEVREQELYTRNTLLEVFSSSTCAPCASANPYIKKAYSAYGGNKSGSELMIIKYQTRIPSPGDPAVVDDGLYRASYYEIQSAPSLRLNGSFYKVSGGWSNMTEDLGDYLQTQQARKTPFQLLADMEREGNHFAVNVNIKNTGAYANKVILSVLFLEDSIHHSPQSNGETDFFYVLRKILPSAYGEVLSFDRSGELSKQYSETFEGKNPQIFNGLNGLSVIVFLQDSLTKDILQVARVQSILSTDAEKENLWLTTSKMYPNPVQAGENAKLHLSLPTDTKLSIDIFDGRACLIKSIPSQNYTQGTHDITLPTAACSRGVYFIKMRNDVQFKIEKLIIL